MGIKCFFMDPVGKEKRFLRRYNGDKKCIGPWSYHDAMTPLDIVSVTYDERGFLVGLSDRTQPPHDDPRWPKRCRCGYEFVEEDEWQVFPDGMMKRTDTGEEVGLREAPAGAMWYATWMPAGMYWDNKTDTDHLTVRLPDGTDWCVDSRANNCTLPNDRTHRCWVRHGVPPNVTVAKDGNTCSAGAGSIKSPNWHGYLRGGELVT
jgi:hypothetical protein